MKVAEPKEKSAAELRKEKEQEEIKKFMMQAEAQRKELSKIEKERDKEMK